MSVLYVIGIKFMSVLIAVAALFNSKARLWIRGRKKIFHRLKADIKPSDKIAWFHCASLGEFEQGRPVIERYKQKYPDYKILLTFYSPSGYEIRKNYKHADYIYYLPIDTPKNANKFLEIAHPEVVFFIKYEFWFYFLQEIYKRNIPLYLVSGIFRPEQRFFKSIAGSSRKMLRFFTHFFVQNDESKQLLNSINLKNVTVTGDTRFDRVYEIAQKVRHLDLVEKFIQQNKLTLIAGSTWKPDEEIIIEYFNKTDYALKLIIAPHEIHKENVSRLENSFKESLKIKKYSEATEKNIEEADVLIIDNIGLLSSLYKYGNVAYIGGGFGKGIHNTLEAATFGLPVMFGPNYLKFQEAIDLIKLGSAFSIKTFADFKDIMDNMLDAENENKRIGELSSEYVRKKCGATDKILNQINHPG